MPYIPQTKDDPMRQTLDPMIGEVRSAIVAVAKTTDSAALMLAYQDILEAIVACISRDSVPDAPVRGLRYRYHLNPILGDLAGAAAEFADRTHSPHERGAPTVERVLVDAAHVARMRWGARSTLRSAAHALGEELARNKLATLPARLNYAISELACFAAKDRVATVSRAHATLLALFRWFYATYARPYEEYAIGYYGDTNGYRALLEKDDPAG